MEEKNQKAKEDNEIKGVCVTSSKILSLPESKRLIIDGVDAHRKRKGKKALNPDSKVLAIELLKMVSNYMGSEDGQKAISNWWSEAKKENQREVVRLSGKHKAHKKRLSDWRTRAKKENDLQIERILAKHKERKTRLGL